MPADYSEMKNIEIFHEWEPQNQEKRTILKKTLERAHSFWKMEAYLKGVEIKRSNRTGVFVWLSHNSICPRAHYDFWIIHSQNAIFTTAY